MKQGVLRYVYGPVFSRRLGRSLGIDLVPYKTCTYDCVYCQLGRTLNKTIERRKYVPVDDVIVELERRLREVPAPNYISLAGSGEPTLNAGVGDLLRKIKNVTDIPVAVLTNGSLLWMAEVREALMEADLLLPSLDAGDRNMFRYVNRPHNAITFERMVSGLTTFTKEFTKSVWLEVLLLGGVTGILSEVKKIAAVAKQVRSDKIQLNKVSRPPAEEYALPVSDDQMHRFTQLFASVSEALVGEDNRNEATASLLAKTTDREILTLLSRRSCTIQGVSMGLGIQANEAAKRLNRLREQGAVVPIRKDRVMFFDIARKK